MSIQSEFELAALRRVGSLVERILRRLAERIRPGVSTLELDAACEELLAREGARSAPREEYGFPGAVCISLNEEAVHGIPGRRTIAPGDVVKLDVTAELDGFVADAARTVVVPPVATVSRRIARAARAAFERGLAAATHGAAVREVGRVVEAEVQRRGFRVLRELTGHGTGRRIHEFPSVPNYDEPRARARLEAGMVLTIEPIIAASTSEAHVQDDGWTIVARDGSLCAHHEETIVITRGRPIVLTRSLRA